MPPPPSPTPPTTAPPRSTTIRLFHPMLTRFIPFLQSHNTHNLRTRPSASSFTTTMTMFATSCLGCFADAFIYLLGPLLILVASGIILGLSCSFFTVFLPMMLREHHNTSSPFSHDNEVIITTKSVFSIIPLMHVTWVVFILVNVIYNYAMCVCTSNKGEKYDIVVRELANLMGFVYPDTDEELSEYKRVFEQKLLERRRARQIGASPVSSNINNTTVADTSTTGVTVIGSNPSANSTTTRRATASTTNNRVTASTPSSSSTNGSHLNSAPAWMLMGAQEWGYCRRSNQPKPPRSHYDHVTRTLVLNMDHFCPWMFNTVGYFNYRHFCTFLIYVYLGMFYGALLSIRPFLNMDSPQFKHQVMLSKKQGFTTVQHLFPYVPIPSERTAIAFSFMLCLSVGIAIFCLLSFHCYLLFTAQTTIEFHGNWANRKRAKRRGRTWVNPYDMGYRRNWEQVFGSGNAMLALLPSSSEPEFLPLPLAGDGGRRRKMKKKDGDLVIRDDGGDLDLGGVGVVGNCDRNDQGAHIV